VDFVSGDGWLAKEKQAVWLMLSRNNVSLPVTVKNNRAVGDCCVSRITNLPIELSVSVNGLNPEGGRMISLGMSRGDSKLTGNVRKTMTPGHRKMPHGLAPGSAKQLQMVRQMRCMSTTILSDCTCDSILVNA